MLKRRKKEGNQIHNKHCSSKKTSRVKRNEGIWCKNTQKDFKIEEVKEVKQRKNSVKMKIEIKRMGKHGKTKMAVYTRDVVKIKKKWFRENTSSNNKKKLCKAKKTC